MASVEVIQTNAFIKAYKRLHDNQKDVVDEAVGAIVSNPELGEAKKGDLAGIYVYKFKCHRQLFLVAYEYAPSTRVLLLLGTHENFYRDLKR
ncbi:hypothetical protein SCT_1101 [Sulfuricella sp. T08]|uniref:type II toxin-antitoxin system RelE/ParE family toxin n=1 Tax=Sulfuricella sp. T08 TaxID=1632857 RepID=UPI0006179FB4|nr:type II toxin-antitoxin system RelE/ParE family toxin [Sulfuricella sp. T08]GAO35710.1 hypothetical protein SCT_1101 [Sulfuricella sp. T08]